MFENSLFSSVQTLSGSCQKLFNFQQFTEHCNSCDNNLWQTYTYVYRSYICPYLSIHCGHLCQHCALTFYALQNSLKLSRSLLPHSNTLSFGRQLFPSEFTEHTCFHQTCTRTLLSNYCCTASLFLMECISKCKTRQRLPPTAGLQRPGKA